MDLSILILDGTKPELTERVQGMLSEVAKELELFDDTYELEPSINREYYALVSGRDLLSIASVVIGEGSNIEDATFMLNPHYTEMPKLYGSLKLDALDMSKLSGYENFSGRGRLCYLELFESAKQGRGYGKQLMDALKNEGFELIETIADPDVKDYFEKNDFVDTYLEVDDGYASVMVWHNPDYG